METEDTISNANNNESHTPKLLLCIHQEHYWLILGTTRIDGARNGTKYIYKEKTGEAQV